MTMSSCDRGFLPCKLPCIPVTCYTRSCCCAAVFIFFNFLLSIAATAFATKAIDEIKVKQREEYNRLSVLSDTLQYEVDQ